MRWEHRRFHELALEELYELLQLRQRVFAVEQRSIYLDLDGRDAAATHVLGRAAPGGPLLAYARWFAPGVRFFEASVGRVVVAPEARSTGLGQALVAESLAGLARAHGVVAVRISAQAHLERFYGRFGFVRDSDVYDEDGIPHLEMVRPVR